MLAQGYGATSFFTGNQAFHCFSLNVNALYAILFPNIPTIQYSNIPFSEITADSESIKQILGINSSNKERKRDVR